ncbi:hypothetical protein STRTUCAR8_08581 [Streptomyces turgidiscabies Car8]|uniref:Uncharacterized protein n=1 Tax=Streptomyces turgidiscabies (strain Car8) TaxID=698760 RepID=L7F7U3_STRT8|nr:hypothetical protein [Streptomyces turgidiscabies]ELP67658.1 hypothetical protein STRTUCAR8_08581 [Streptomyces turgidiscabies Car8]
MRAPTTVQWLRTAVHRIAIGSGRRATYLAAWVVRRARSLWSGARKWLDEGTGIGWLLRAGVLLGAAAILRKVAVALAAGIYHRVENGGAPWLLWGAAACWVVSAYRAGADDWKPKRPAAPAPVDEEQEQPPPKDEAGGEEKPAVVEQPKAPPVSPVELVAAVRDVGTPHAQLKPLAEHLRTTTDAVRAAAAGIGWPVKDVRMEGRSSSAGLRWDDCPSPEQAYPSPGVVGAGQAATDDNDDRPGEGREKGLRVVAIGQGGVVVQRLAEMVRHHSLRKP